MGRPRSVPKYRRHRQSGQAIVTLSDGMGGRRDLLLGKHGTKESRVEYARIVTEWETAGRTLPPLNDAGDLTVNELAVAFWKHAEAHYRRPDGSHTSEVAEYKAAMRPLVRLYGHTRAAEFGPLALKSVRQAMIDGSHLTPAEKAKRLAQGRKTTCCRGVVNQRIGRVRRIYKWAAENELLPASVFHGLQTVRGLQRGRSEARETEPVKPVRVEFVEAVVPFLRPQVAAMVQLQLHTGMRPGEVAVVRGIDLDTSGKVWLYRPGSDQGREGQHKTAWRGHERVVPIGPRAQEIMKPWLRLNVREYLFEPREAEAERDRQRREVRKSLLTPSQAKRQPKKRPKKSPGDHYTVSSYGHAIADAIGKANAARACATCQGLEAEARCAACQSKAIPHWHPHQLRHTKATEIRREYGLDAARAVLGHRSPAITEVYAELDAGKAAEVMAQIG